ncbi:MAG: hypothetical protein JWO39_938 [Gemmatimonadetes bacterium]|nr:hypothetical protein [Gemmatimonadota bacterium]
MIALVLALLRIAAGPVLHGVILSSDEDVPLASAMVEAYAADSSHAYARTYTDSLGAYTFPQLSPGSYRLRVTRAGYGAREMEVLIAGASAVEVNIALQHSTKRLPDVRVFAVDRSDANAEDSAAAWIAAQDVGTVSLSGSTLHADPALASADVLESFSARGAAIARDEAPTSLHVHGGAAAENAVLLDGVPLFNPYHASGTLSAIEPDLISRATLHASAPDATFGDATGGIIELETSPPDSGSLSTQGAYSGRTLRESVGIPLSALHGSALISARRSTDAPLSDNRDISASGISFHDLFARAMVPLRGGQLEAFAFHSGDRIGFDAGVEHLTPEGAPPDGSSPDGVPPDGVPHTEPHATAQPNALSWTTGTDALRWSSGGDTQWELRAWRTSFDAQFGWAPATQLRSSYEQLGTSAQAQWQVRGVQLTAGVDATKLNIGYNAGTGSDATSTPLTLNGSPWIVSTITEARWKIADQWSFALGLRDPVIAPSGRGLEPRMSIRYAPNHRVSLGVGYSRLHQYVQSMRNEESLIDALAGITLPVAAGSSANGQTVPVARADQLTASLDARLTSTIALSALAYVRHEDGIVLIAPVSAAPFATSGFATGTSNAKGVTVLLERTGERVSGELAYTLSSASRRAGAESYTPTFAATHTLSLGVGARVWPTTTLRAAASVNSGLPASLYADPIEWAPYTPSSGSGDISGSPQHIIGAVDGVRLPPYLRLDIGIRREWGFSLFGVGAHIAGSASVMNVLGRSNAIGAATSSGGSLQWLQLPARSVEVGLEWRH